MLGVRKTQLFSNYFQKSEIFGSGLEKLVKNFVEKLGFGGEMMKKWVGFVENSVFGGKTGWRWLLVLGLVDDGGIILGE